jgi:hypothetical protein
LLQLRHETAFILHRTAFYVGHRIH